jgi:hypothetical protein
MAHLLTNNDEKRQQDTIKGIGYLIVFIAVAYCELLLIISLYGLVMKMSGVRLLSPAPYLYYQQKKPRLRGVLFNSCLVPLGTSNVGCLQTFGALLDIKVNSLAFYQCLEAVSTDSRKMYEYIFAAISGGDKTKTFGIVEPFNSACSHVAYL